MPAFETLQSTCNVVEYEQDVQMMRAVYATNQWAHVSRGAGSGDKYETA